MPTLNQIAAQAYQTAEEKGHHDDLQELPQRIALTVRLAWVHTEVTEATQTVKRYWSENPSDETRDSLAEEIADAVIRLCERAESVGIDLDYCVEWKMEKNRQREHRYGIPKA